MIRVYLQRVKFVLNVSSQSDLNQGIGMPNFSRVISRRIRKAVKLNSPSFNMASPYLEPAARDH